MSAGTSQKAALQCACSGVQLNIEGIPTFQVRKRTLTSRAEQTSWKTNSRSVTGPQLILSCCCVGLDERFSGASAVTISSHQSPSQCRSGAIVTTARSGIKIRRLHLWSFPNQQSQWYLGRTESLLWAWETKSLLDPSARYPNADFVTVFDAANKQHRGWWSSFIPVLASMSLQNCLVRLPQTAKAYGETTNVYEVYWRSLWGRIAYVQDCGFRLYNQHEGYAYRSFPATNLDGFNFEPQAHVYCMDADPKELMKYKEDGLKKFADRVSALAYFIQTRLCGRHGLWLCSDMTIKSKDCSYPYCSGPHTLQSWLIFLFINCCREWNQ